MGAGLKQVYKWGQPVSGASKPGQHEGVGYQENHRLLPDLNLGSEGALGGWGLGLRQSRPRQCGRPVPGSGLGEAAGLGVGVRQLALG